MIKLLNTAQMRELDRHTVEDIGIPETILMENAGLAMLDVIQEKYESLAGLRVNLFIGKGNNGGDGSVTARHLLNLGAAPIVFLMAKKEELGGDAKLNLDRFVSIGGKVKEITEPKHLNNFKIAFMHTTVVVDCLLGTGLKSAPTGLYADVIDIMNKYGEFKIACDISTGLNADGGAIPGKHFVADVTATLGARKLCCFLPPAREASGETLFYDISIPQAGLEKAEHSAWLIENSDMAHLLPVRPTDGHKGVFGHLAMACGSLGMGGAAGLAGLGALRVGAGLVTAGVPNSIAPSFELGCKEVMTISLESTDDGGISAHAADRFIAFAKDKTVVLIGPGMGQDPSTKSFVHRVVTEVERPMVIDADGLNLIGRESGLIKGRQAPTVVTPHPGEMARLTGKTTAEIQTDRLSAAKALAEQIDAVVVLKGAATIIAAPDGEAYVNPTGNHGLASGGTGDVLSGMIAGLLAQGIDPTSAAICGVYLHGKAADMYAERFSPRSLIASDLLDLLPEVLGEY